MVQGPDNVTVVLEIPREVDPEVYDMYGPNGGRLRMLRMLKEAGLLNGPRVQVYHEFRHMLNQPNPHLINRRQVQIMNKGHNSIVKFTFLYVKSRGALAGKGGWGQV